MPMEKTKAKTLDKLINSGYDTEKKITGMDLQSILSVPKITVPEITIITEFQSAIKSRSVIAYLSEGIDEITSKSIEPEITIEEPEESEEEDNGYYY